MKKILNLPDGKQQLIEGTSRAASRYGYEKVEIEIPEEVRKILSH